MPNRHGERHEMKLEDLQDAMRRARALRSAYFAKQLRQLRDRLRRLVHPAPGRPAHAR